MAYYCLVRQIRSFDKDIKDLQGEFEVERSDYLETIRRQDHHLRLLQQILAKVQPLIRKDCNYWYCSEIDSLGARDFRLKF